MKVRKSFSYINMYLNMCNIYLFMKRMKLNNLFIYYIFMGTRSSYFRNKRNFMQIKYLNLGPQNLSNFMGDRHHLQ